MDAVDWAAQLRAGAARCRKAAWRQDPKTAATLRLLAKTFDRRALAADREAVAVLRAQANRLERRYGWAPGLRGVSH